MNAADKFDQIRGTPFFSKINPNFILRNINFFEIRELRKGKYLYYQGDSSGFVYYLISGIVSEIKELKNTLIYLGEFSIDRWYGVEEMLISSAYYHNILIKQNSVFISLSKFNFLTLLRDNEFQNLIIKEIAKNYRILEAKINLDTPDIKIAKYLLLSVQENKNNRLSLKITQEYLADQVNCTRETVNKHLKNFEKLDLIALARGKIILRDIRGLRELIGQ